MNRDDIITAVQQLAAVKATIARSEVPTRERDIDAVNRLIIDLGAALINAEPFHASLNIAPEIADDVHAAQLYQAERTYAAAQYALNEVIQTANDRAHLETMSGGQYGFIVAARDALEVARGRINRRVLKQG